MRWVTLRYSTTFIIWIKYSLQDIHRKTRKIFTIYGGLHQKSNIDKLYVPRKEVGKRLILIKECVELAITGLELYIYNSDVRQIQAASTDKIDGLQVANILKIKTKQGRLQSWKDKVLYWDY